MNKLKCLLKVLVLFSCLSTGAQDLKIDTTQTGKAAQLLYTIDSLRTIDSLKREALLKEIENLSGTRTNRQRQELLKQLNEERAKDSLRELNMQNELSKLKAIAIGAPVAPFADTLFYIFTKVGSFSATDRAKAVSKKVSTLYKDFAFVSDSVRLIQDEGSVDIIYRDLVVMSVNEMEARWHSKSRMELAQDYRSLIINAVENEREIKSLKNILIRLGEVILILAGIFLLILLINKLFSRLRRKVIRLKDTVLSKIRIRGYKFLDSRRGMQAVMFLLNGLRWILIILALYLTLPLLFSVFPWTEGIANTMFNWILDPLTDLANNIVAYLPNLFTILVIATATHFTIKFLRFIATEIRFGLITIPGFYPDWAMPTFTLVRVLLYAFSFIVIFPYLPGSESPIFQGVSVFLGLLFSLGSSSAISNAVAGFVITYMRPFKLGDRIKIGEISGDVIEKSLLVTRVRTTKNEEITIPNSMVLSGHTINYTSSAKELGLILHTTVTIGYDVPWKQVHELLINAALACDGIIKDENRKPFVLQTSLDDFYVAYQINAYTEQPNGMLAIYSELHQNIQDKFNEAGVEIMSPHYRAARDGNTTTIPSNYLPKDYQAPSFNVSVKNPGEK